MRKIVLVAILASFVGTPVMRAMADEGTTFERSPAAEKNHKKKKKKSASKKKSKKHASSKHGKSSHATHSKSHAPKASAMPTAPQYPTQPGAGSMSDIPNEKKDDLPPPQTPPND